MEDCSRKLQSLDVCDPRRRVEGMRIAIPLTAYIARGQLQLQPLAMQTAACMVAASRDEISAALSACLAQLMLASARCIVCRDGGLRLLQALDSSSLISNEVKPMIDELQLLLLLPLLLLLLMDASCVQLRGTSRLQSSLTAMPAISWPPDCICAPNTLRSLVCSLRRANPGHNVQFTQAGMVLYGSVQAIMS